VGLETPRLSAIYSFDNIRQEDDKWWSIIKQDMMMWDMRRMEVLTYLDILTIPQAEAVCVGFLWSTL
jgi:hypothetical protein